ncbi:glycosyltransferase family 4 protein [Halorhodospira sp. 9622]|uniref:glycosyltransferase family 4 protein n=1 Tax=Halorhodospira sp. 9622 TaxID=2899136 RepID=UPI001EE8367C|nr:glycosyltransferase family 4 protein [Halorhodospira sp. 9622]MCG5539094.1 glycosyltransferase family 4 protein [Halorhodospira sp. 9622]
MRLLFVVKQSALNRGMNTGIENLAWSLARRVDEVIILSGGRNPSVTTYTYPNNVHYYFSGGEGDPGDHITLYNDIRCSYHIDAVIGWSRNIGPLLQQEHDQNQRPLFIANEGALTRSTNPFLKALSIAYRQRRLPSRYVFFQKKFGASVDSFVAISKAVAGNFSRNYAVDPDQIHVIPRGVDTNLFEPSGKRTQGAPDFRIIYSGNISFGKGVVDVAKAIATLRTPITFVLCGTDRGALESIRKIFDESPQHTVDYKGPLSTTCLKNELQNSDVFAFCSHSEGLGKSLLEAMSVGLPAVTSDIPTFKELIVHRENGLMATTGDRYSIAGALDQLINDRSLRESCGENARKTIINGFSREREAEKWLEILMHNKPPAIGA